MRPQVSVNVGPLVRRKGSDAIREEDVGRLRLSARAMSSLLIFLPLSQGLYLGSS